MTRESLIEGETTDHVIGAFFEVYNGLGFGFLERIYVDALEIELLARSRKVQREVRFLRRVHSKKGILDHQKQSEP